MKKLYILSGTLLLLALSSCKNDYPDLSQKEPIITETTKTTPNSTSTETTTIIYDQKSIDIKYLKQEATCTTPAIYYYSSITGEKGTETFQYGEALGHDVTNHLCSRCGAYIDDIEWGPLH